MESLKELSRDNEQDSFLAQEIGGDSADFEQLAKEFEPMINKIMHTLNIYKNKEEFFQLGLISLWQAQQQYNPAKGKFASYAYSYIKGRFQTEMTKANRIEGRVVYPKEEFWEVIEDGASESPLERQYLLSFCDGLTPTQKKWLLYTCLEGLSVKEIAAKENVSPSAVKQWRKGAREKLKNTFSL
jgi:RNA polymerase sigma factor (sigma-70 family)